jgi:hypothetical protein
VHARVCVWGGGRVCVFVCVRVRVCVRWRSAWHCEGVLSSD